MGFDFKPTLWFVCRLCQHVFPNTDKLKAHKLESHLGDSLRIKTIIFEEKFLDHRWTPEFPFEQSSNESLLAKTSKQSQNNDQSFHCERVDKFQNPQVSLTKLTPQKFISATSTSSETFTDGIEPIQFESTNLFKFRQTHTNADSNNTDANFQNQYKPEELINSSPNAEIESNSNDCDWVADADVDPLLSDDDNDDPTFTSQDFLELEYRNEEVQDNESTSTLEENEDETPAPKKKKKERVLKIGSKYKCTVGNCTRLFNSSNAVWKHKRYQHFQELGTPAYSCPFPNCKLTFGVKSSFFLHLRTHRDKIDDREWEAIVGKYTKKKNMKRMSTGTSSSKLLVNEELNSESSDLDLGLDLPLGVWLLMQKEKDPSNIIALDPDPTSTSIDPDAESFKGVSEGQRVKCLLCQEFFISEASLRNHVLKCWKLNKKMHCYCHLCHRSFNFHRYLDRHNETWHSTLPNAPRVKFKCSRCPKEFLRKRSRKIHEENHDRDPNSIVKDFLCPICGALFSAKNILWNHMLTHSTEKPWKCTREGCNAAFKLRCLLNTHILRFHESPTFTCSFCGRSCKSEITLQNHERTHTGELPFKCDKCDKAYAAHASLHQHRLSSHRMELGIPEVVCPFPNCGQTFTSSRTVKRHVQRKHSESLVDV